MRQSLRDSLEREHASRRRTVANVGPPTRQQPVAVVDAWSVLPLLHAERPVTVSARRSADDPRAARRSRSRPAEVVTRLSDSRAF